MRLLRAATLTTPDPEVTAARYARWLDYDVVERGVVSADLAASWAAPASEGRDYVICRPTSGAAVFIRFVAGEPHPEYAPLRTFGWAAIEICVQDTLATHARMSEPDCPFEVIGPPRELDGMPMIFPMQVKGPDGEIVYLTQIRSDPPGMALPRAESAIDRLFILVLACSDLATSARWLQGALGVDVGPMMAITYTMLAQAFDLPIEVKHPIATATHQGDCFLELDQYPSAAIARPGHAGALKPGVALATFLHPDLSSVSGWIAPPSVREGALYEGRLVGTLSGPDETLIELVQA
jgi:hypothetical protein